MASNLHYFAEINVYGTSKANSYSTQRRFRTKKEAEAAVEDFLTKYTKAMEESRPFVYTFDDDNLTYRQSIIIQPKSVQSMIVQGASAVPCKSNFKPGFHADAAPAPSDLDHPDVTDERIAAEKV